MNAVEAMERIEGHAFSTMVNLASDFRTFLRILGSQPEVQSLSAAMKSENLHLKLLGRVLDLAQSPVDHQYEHPADAAMAAYLWLLSINDQDYSELAAETIAECKHCWWARQMAEHLRDTARFRSRAGSIRRVVSAGGVDVDYTAHVREASVPVQTLLQLAGRVNRAATPGAGAAGVVIYPIAESQWPDLFRNRNTRDRTEEILAET
jgi:hypothetical protein